MLTKANLTAADWQKISPDLRWSLEQAARFPTWRVRDLERGIPLLTGLFTGGGFAGGIRADVTFTHVDGKQYYMVDTAIPAAWTSQMWTDFVVGIVKSPHVREVGTLREWPVTRTAITPEGGIRVASPHELASAAGRAPSVRVTPEQVPHPVIQPGPGRQMPVPSPVGGAPPGGGPVGQVAGALGISPSVLVVGGMAVVGVVVLALVLRRR